MIEAACARQPKGRARAQWLFSPGDDIAHGGRIDRYDSALLRYSRPKAEGDEKKVAHE